MSIYVKTQNQTADISAPIYYDSFVDVVEKTLDPKTNRVIQKIVSKKLDSKDLEGLTADDFSLDSIILAESTDLLKPVGKLSPNPLDCSDHLESYLDTLNINPINTDTNE